MARGRRIGHAVRKDKVAELSFLTDTHCHIGAYADPAAILREAKRTNVRVVVATENPEEFKMLRTRIGRSEWATVGLGLHPAGTAVRSQAQLSRFFRMLPEARWVSEIGLDFGRVTAQADRRMQERAFRAVLDHALIESRTLSVHSRGAAKEVVEHLEGTKAAVVLHWYSGPRVHAEKALEIGCFFSLNPSMVRSEKGQKLADWLPRERVLIESDGPFAKSGSLPARPADTWLVAEYLASRWAMTMDQTVAQLDLNLQAMTSREA